MSYIPTGITDEQEKLLLDIDPDSIRALTTHEKLDLALRKKEMEAAKSSARWNAIATAATVFIPLATFFGLTALFSPERKARRVRRSRRSTPPTVTLQRKS